MDRQHLRTWSTRARRKTRREIFLERMDSLSHGINWKSASARSIRRRAGAGGPELSAMLRNTACSCGDPGMEDALQVERAVQRSLSGPLPDETTILNFRHLLEEHELGQSCLRRSTVWSPRLKKNLGRLSTRLADEQFLNRRRPRMSSSGSASASRRAGTAPPGSRTCWPGSEGARGASSYPPPAGSRSRSPRSPAGRAG